MSKTSVLTALVAAALFAPFASAQAAQNGPYALTVPQGSEGVSGRATLNAAGPYQICLRADRPEPTEVELSVNGHAYGSYRLNAWGSTCLDRIASSQSWERLPGPGWSVRLQDRIVARFVPVQSWGGGFVDYVDAYGRLQRFQQPRQEWRDFGRAVTVTLTAEAPLAAPYGWPSYGPDVASAHPGLWSGWASHRVVYR